VDGVCGGVWEEVSRGFRVGAVRGIGLDWGLRIGDFRFV